MFIARSEYGELLFFDDKIRYVLINYSDRGIKYVQLRPSTQSFSCSV